MVFITQANLEYVCSLILLTVQAIATLLLSCDMCIIKTSNNMLGLKLNNSRLIMQLGWKDTVQQSLNTVCLLRSICGHGSINGCGSVCTIQGVPADDTVHFRNSRQKIMLLLILMDSPHPETNTIGNSWTSTFSDHDQ